MPLVGKAHTRAFAFRDATAAVRAARISVDWTDVVAHTPPFVPDSLPYEPVPLASADIAALVSECEIDHGVGPIAHTKGGTVAGYARWRDFVNAGRIASGSASISASVSARPCVICTSRPLSFFNNFMS